MSFKPQDAPAPLSLTNLYTPRAVTAVLVASLDCEPVVATATATARDVDATN